MENRKSQESPIYTPSFNLLYSHYLNENINLNSGISFVQFGEKTDYNIVRKFNVDTTFTYSDSITFLSWDSINHVVYIAYNEYDVDTSFIDSTTIKNARTNKHSYINIPLLVGYNFNFNKLDINLKAGIGVGFLVRSKAQYVNYNLNDFIMLQPKKINLNYIFSPSFSYKITKQIALQVNPQILINSSKLIHYEDLKQRYTNWSVHVGLCYSLK